MPYPQYGNYGIEVDPELLKRAKAGPGIADAADAWLKSAAAEANPVMSPQYGVGATPIPARIHSETTGMVGPAAAPGLTAPATRTDMESRWSGLTAPRGIAAQPAQAAPATAAGQRPAQALQSIATPSPSNLSPIRYMGGGFVGAATDEQATKAMHDRMSQYAASQQNIASMNAGAEAERDARAARLGVSRGVLDRMEGRNDTAAAAADSAAQGAIPDRWNNPMALPGDSFQDTRGRMADLERLREQAASGNRREQQGAQIGLQSLGGIVGQNMAEQDRVSRERIAREQQQAGIARDARAAQGDAEQRQFDRQKWGQQFGLDAAKFGLDSQKATLDAQRQSILDQSTLDKNAKASPNDIKAALMRRYLEGGKDAPDALAALQKLFPTNDLSALLGAGAQ